MRESLKSLATLVVSSVLCLAVVEGVLRVLPVCSDLEVQAVDASNPIIRFRPDSEFVFSDGFWLTNANRGHINNFGFVNDQDYDPDDLRPLLAVIGDSYVQALMVPYGSTVQGRLAAHAAELGCLQIPASSGSVTYFHAQGPALHPLEIATDKCSLARSTGPRARGT